MNITSVFCTLAFFSIFCSSVHGVIWPLRAVDIDDEVYLDGVSIERESDGDTWFIYANPQGSTPSSSNVVYGPFKLRPFGLYSMLISEIWVNTTSNRIYLTITFSDADLARQFYRVLNTHHRPSFQNTYGIKQLLVHSPPKDETYIFENDVPKALDVFVLKTASGYDSKIRRYVVHDTTGEQNPILIFNSSECSMKVDNDAIKLLVSPQKSLVKYPFTIRFANSAIAQHLLQEHTALKSQIGAHNLQDLVASQKNAYPLHGESSTRKR